MDVPAVDADDDDPDAVELPEQLLWITCVDSNEDIRKERRERRS